jgi:hypothetical protein
LIGRTQTVNSSSNGMRGTSGNDSAVPTGLESEVHDSPGTEVPGYSLCVPNGTRSDDSTMIHQTNLVRLRILRDTFCFDFESILDHFGKHPVPDMKQPKLSFSALGSSACPKIAGSVCLADELRTNYNGRTPDPGLTPGATLFPPSGLGILSLSLYFMIITNQFRA